MNSYPDLDVDDFEFYYDFLNKNNLYYKTIIDHCIGYMRILSSLIVDLGTQHNKHDRVTYRGVCKNILPEIEVGETFRAANWL